MLEHHKDCDICSQLGEVETSFSKYGREEMERALPPAAARLTPLGESPGPGVRHQQMRRCPLCGTLYLYEFTYDYYVNGSEDEETLTRLSAAEARAYWLTQGGNNAEPGAGSPS